MAQPAVDAAPADRRAVPSARRRLRSLVLRLHGAGRADRPTRRAAAGLRARRRARVGEEPRVPPRVAHGRPRPRPARAVPQRPPGRVRGGDRRRAGRHRAGRARSRRGRAALVRRPAHAPAARRARPRSARWRWRRSTRARRPPTTITPTSRTAGSRHDRRHRAVRPRRPPRGADHDAGGVPRPRQPHERARPQPLHRGLAGLRCRGAAAAGDPRRLRALVHQRHGRHRHGAAPHHPRLLRVPRRAVRRRATRRPATPTSRPRWPRS